MSTPTKEQIAAIFSKYERPKESIDDLAMRFKKVTEEIEEAKRVIETYIYVPEGPSANAPLYVPMEKRKPLTIEAYKARIAARKPKPCIPPAPPKKQRNRAGLKVRLAKEKQECLRMVSICKRMGDTTKTKQWYRSLKAIRTKED